MLLYIGNKLSKHGNTPSSIELLGVLLSEEFNLVSVSDKKNKILRLGDMLSSIIKYRKKIECILIDTYSTSNFYYALLCSQLAKYLNIDYIPILHGGDLPQRIKNNPRFSKSIFTRSLINVAPSKYLYDEFSKKDFKVCYIPNFIPIEKYNFKQRKKVTPRLLYVRAFNKIYNPVMAIYVLQKLVVKFPDSKLCMVGPDGDGMVQEIKDLCSRLNLLNHVVFTGKLAKEKWIELSQKYDVFINTTNIDNMPVSVIEAMALGLPVISTDVGGIPYLLEDQIDSLLVGKNDVESMYQQIVKLIENPEICSSITDNARNKVEHFDRSIIKSQWVTLINKLQK